MALIDQAAMAAGLIGSDDYTEAFRWGDPQERAAAHPRMSPPPSPPSLTRSTSRSTGARPWRTFARRADSEQIKAVQPMKFKSASPWDGA